MQTISADTICFLPDVFRSDPEQRYIVQRYFTYMPAAKARIVLSELLVCFLHSGTKEVLTSGGKVCIYGGQLLLLAPGSVLMSERIAAQNGYSSTLFFFPQELILAFLSKVPPSKPERSESTGAFVHHSDNFTGNFCESLHILERLAPCPSEMLRNKALELLHYLTHMHGSSFLDFLRRCPDVTSTALHFTATVNANLDNHLSIGQLAFLCNMSISTFKRRFTQQFGISPGKYMTRRTMEKAATLLRSGLRPSEIYSELGYEHLSAFSNQFKKHFGTAPGAFMETNEPIAHTFERFA